MEYQHFIGEGPEATALIDKIATRTGEFNRAVDDLEKRLGLKFWGHRTGIGGPQLEEQLDDAEARMRGMKYKCRFPGKDALHCYLPHLGTKAGKVMKAEIDGVNRLYCDASATIIKAIGMGRMVAQGRILAMSAAGYAQGKIVIKVPCGLRGGEFSDALLGEDPMPTPPAWLRPAKESEVLALYGK